MQSPTSPPGSPKTHKPLKRASSWTAGSLGGKPARQAARAGDRIHPSQHLHLTFPALPSDSDPTEPPLNSPRARLDELLAATSMTPRAKDAAGVKPPFELTDESKAWFSNLLSTTLDAKLEPALAKHSKGFVAQEDFSKCITVIDRVVKDVQLLKEALGLSGAEDDGKGDTTMGDGPSAKASYAAQAKAQAAQARSSGHTTTSGRPAEGSKYDFNAAKVVTNKMQVKGSAALAEFLGIANGEELTSESLQKRMREEGAAKDVTDCIRVFRTVRPNSTKRSGAGAGTSDAAAAAAAPGPIIVTVAFESDSERWDDLYFRVQEELEQFARTLRSRKIQCSIAEVPTAKGTKDRKDLSQLHQFLYDEGRFPKWINGVLCATTHRRRPEDPFLDQVPVDLDAVRAAWEAAQAAKANA